MPGVENIVDHGTNVPEIFWAPRKRKVERRKSWRGEKEEEEKTRGKYERKCKKQANDKKF